MGGASPYLGAVRAEHVGPAARSLRFALLEPPGLGALLGPALLNFFDLGASRRTWSEVGAGNNFPGIRLTPARLSWSQLSGVGANLESAFGTGANLESTSASWSQPGVNHRKLQSTWSQHLKKVGASLESAP